MAAAALHSVTSDPQYADPFKVGERLSYQIRLGPVTVGHSTMAVPGRTKYNGTDCLVFQTTARAAPLIQVFFPVDDRITSYWDPRLRRPLWVEKRLNEGNFHRNYEARFDYPTRRAFWKETVFAGNTGKAGELKAGAKWKDRVGVTENIPGILQDMLSSIYYSRSSDAHGNPGDVFSMPVFDDLQVATLHMTILRRETLSLVVNGKAADFSALVTRPHIVTTGLFRSRGDLTIWISEDEHRFPLKIVAGIAPLGSLTTELYEAM